MVLLVDIVQWEGAGGMTIRVVGAVRKRSWRRGNQNCLYSRHGYIGKDTMFHCYYNSSLTSPLFVFCIYSFFFLFSFFYPTLPPLFVFSILLDGSAPRCACGNIYIYIYILSCSARVRMCVLREAEKKEDEKRKKKKVKRTEKKNIQKTNSRRDSPTKQHKEEKEGDENEKKKKTFASGWGRKEKKKSKQQQQQEGRNGAVGRHSPMGGGGGNDHSCGGGGEETVLATWQPELPVQQARIHWQGYDVSLLL
ncbi:hypothetical protein TCSYLVIO_000945 [Trypanosoma cruzi]|nr:hypothetical protein TCSYLVIO_000945 [Trypanosoma cruzi]